MHDEKVRLYQGQHQGNSTPSFTDADTRHNTVPFQKADNLTKYQKEMMSLPYKNIEFLTEEMEYDPVNKDVTVPVMVTYPANELLKLH